VSQPEPHHAEEPVAADVAIVGAGPAALLLAAQLCRRNVSVAVVAPNIDREWPATYAVWFDELPPEVQATVAHRWDSVVAWGHRRHDVARAYCIIDNARLRRQLLDQLGASSLIDAAVISSSSTRTIADTSGSLQLNGVHGALVRSRLIVDASGGAGWNAPPRRGAAVQAAVGRRVPSPVDVAGHAVMMDWRPADAASAKDATFMYVLDTGRGEQLVEETSLARTPALPLVELRRRLGARLGVADLVEGADEEQVAIVMTSPSRHSSPGIVRFGAAAGFVHPATGYSLTTSARRAPRVADAIVAALQATPAGPVESTAVERAVWPRSARATRALHDFGLKALLRLSADEVADFFDIFFDLPTESAAIYLSTESDPKDVARVMWTIFAQSPWRLRRRLV
jgi:lycopene beta-cyclase